MVKRWQFWVVLAGLSAVVCVILIVLQQAPFSPLSSSNLDDRIKWTYKLGDSSITFMDEHLRNAEWTYNTNYVHGYPNGEFWGHPHVVVAEDMVLICEWDSTTAVYNLTEEQIARYRENHPPGEETAGYQASIGEFYDSINYMWYGKVTALDPSGELLWSRLSPFSKWHPDVHVKASPSGKAYCFDNDDPYDTEASENNYFEFSALSRDGPPQERTRIEGPDSIRPVAAHVTDDVIYVVGKQTANMSSGKLFCYDHHGNLLWDYIRTEPERGGVSRVLMAKLGNDGLVRLLTTWSVVVSLDEAGQELWSTPVGHTPEGVLAAHDLNLGPDGSVYLPCPVSSKIHALEPDGKRKWEVDPQDVFPQGEQDRLHEIYPNQIVETGMAVGADGTSYARSRGGTVCALNKDGTVKWWYRPREARGCADYRINVPVVGPDGSVYISRRLITAITPEGKRKWSITLPGGGHATRPVIGQDGTIYVLSDATLYALEP